ncbi:hypothetical protein Pcinc_023785 [Petrolisthes cinctipes]|uniref:Uncharacterized protein n=1 Tax=Petrolisthes cinctipes TaxID=88211 RepID=A0AAE1FB93_PETCI|nr:hypothetical protein Pcinc_023785 [Petrolisthes cinctipes]
MEKHLAVWMEDCFQKRKPLCLMMLQEKALSLFKDLKADSDEDTTFNASHGELEKQRKEGEEAEEEEVEVPTKHFQTKVIAQAFALVEEALALLESQDPNEERHVKVSSAVKDALKCYQVIYDEKKKAVTQSSLHRFFKRVDKQETPVPSTSQSVSSTSEPVPLLVPSSPITDDPSPISSPPSSPSTSSRELSPSPTNPAE